MDETNVTPSNPEEQSISEQPQAPAGVAGPGTVPNGPPEQIPPMPAGPQQAPSFHGTLFHNVMTALGGGDKTDYVADPQTGEVKQITSPKTTGQLAKSIVAGAITGMLAGAGRRAQEAVGAGGAAVMQQRQQQDAQQKLEAQQNYEKTQKALVAKAQIFEANARAALNIQQAEKLGDKRMDSYIGYNKSLYESALNEGRVSQDRVTQEEAMEGMKSGKYNPARDMFIPIARIPRIKSDGAVGEGSELVGAIITDGPFDLNTGNFPKDKAVQYGFLPPAVIAQGANIKTSTANQIAQKIQTVDSAKDEMNLIHKKLGTAADAMPNFDEAIKTPGMTQALSKFQSYVNAAKGFDPLEAINLMSKEKQDKQGNMLQNPDAKYVPLVLKAFGGQEVLDKYEKMTGKTPEMSIAQAVDIRAKAGSGLTVDPDQLKRANSVYEQNVQLAGAKAGATEQAKQDVATKTEKEQEKFLTTPADWTMDDASKTKQMDQFEAERYLKSKGWTLPQNFAELYGIGTGDLDPKRDPQKGYRGTDVVTAQNAAAFIRKAINPTFSDTDFLNRKQIEQEYASKKANTAGGTLYAAGVAAQHLQSLEKSVIALNNGNMQPFNALANELGVQTGDPAPVIFAALANKVNSEVEKVVSGGAPLEAQLKEMRTTLQTKESPKQIRGVVKAYLNLMAGRLNELDSAYNQATGKHIPISDKARSIYGEHGEGTESEWFHAKPSGHLPAQTGGAGPKSVKVGGQDISVAGDGTFQLNGHTYKVNPDGAGGTLVK